MVIVTGVGLDPGTQTILFRVSLLCCPHTLACPPLSLEREHFFLVVCSRSFRIESYWCSSCGRPIAEPITVAWGLEYAN